MSLNSNRTKKFKRLVLNCKEFLKTPLKEDKISDFNTNIGQNDIAFFKDKKGPLGKLLAKALLENLTVNCCFNKIIYQLILGEKIEFKDILEGTKVLEELIEKEQISFIPNGIQIDEHLNGNFRITYQDMEFVNVNVGEAIPLLIALNSLLTYKPIITLMQIKEELDYFLEKFRSYSEAI